MNEIMGSFTLLKNPAILMFICKGVIFTLIISVLAVTISIGLASVLALVRNYCVKPGQRIFRWLAVVYIEIFRNTPLLFWIFISVVFFPAPKLFTHQLFGLSSVETKLLFKTTAALTLFEAATIAEIIRGGLNSISNGQFEAGRAQGFNTVQIMLYIILPQAFRNIVPTLLSQVITTIKDSSFIANVATIELMARVKKILSNASLYNGTGTINVSDVFILFGFAALIYFIINYILSCVVRHIQERKQKQLTEYVPQAVVIEEKNTVVN
ncbi:MAG: amino acid ABC transporter permease [Megasphaera sp.]|jgi:putative glutamine transport system permease protein|nr:amino acid ABC transporter permease [Megasphaera sp.]MCH4187509.1 amino acid ABC transporter permease [Megasphaera sp.]MCH4217767.1 amino acid ABC transporter permease [Megasphaera sp.]